MSDDIDRASLLAWVERIATHLAAVDGLPPITGRILGWLMVCDPAEQSAGQIAEAIGASMGSMTPNLRQLTTVGFVEKTTRPGERTAYYRLVDNAWRVVVEQQAATLGAFRTITADGIDMLGADTARSRRIREAEQVLGWLQGLLLAGPPLDGTGAGPGAPAPGRRRSDLPEADPS